MPVAQGREYEGALLPTGRPRPFFVSPLPASLVTPAWHELWLPRHGRWLGILPLELAVRGRLSGAAAAPGGRSGALSGWNTGGVAPRPIPVAGDVCAWWGGQGGAAGLTATNDGVAPPPPRPRPPAADGLVNVTALGRTWTSSRGA